LHELLALAASPADQPLQLPGHELPRSKERCSPVTLQALVAMYETHVPRPDAGDEPGQLRDAERALGALKVLVYRGLSAQDLETLIHRGRDYDVVRSAISSVLVFASGFFPAGVMTLCANSMVTPSDATPSSNEPHAGPEAPWQQLLPWGAWVVGNVAIGLGGEGAAAALREAGWQAGYNRPMARGTPAPGAPVPLTPVASRPCGVCVQATTALPFGVAYTAHTLAGGRLGPGFARLGLGALAAATGGTWRELGLRSGADALDPVWLDGSSQARQQVMHDAIERLQSRGVALERAVQDLLQGVAQASGQPSTTALKRSGARALLAAVARGGQAIAMATRSASDSRMNVLADGWLGAVWGLLSTVPARAFGPGSAKPAALGRSPQIVPAPPSPAGNAAVAAQAITTSGIRNRATPRGLGPGPADRV
jgi:hypothetical protein